MGEQRLILNDWQLPFSVKDFLRRAPGPVVVSYGGVGTGIEFVVRDEETRRRIIEAHQYHLAMEEFRSHEWDPRRARHMRDGTVQRCQCAFCLTVLSNERSDSAKPAAVSPR